MSNKTKVAVPLIVAQAPINEEFNLETFIVNEAGWITTAHLTNIETAMQAAADQAGVAEQAAQQAAARILDLETELTKAQNDLATQVAATQAATTTIETLQQRIVQLGKAAAGDFSSITKPGADIVPGAVDESAQYLTSVDQEAARMKKGGW